MSRQDEVRRTGSSATPKKAPLLVRTLSGLPSPVSLSTTSDFSRCFRACTQEAGSGGGGRCRDLQSAAARMEAQLGGAAMRRENEVLSYDVDLMQMRMSCGRCVHCPLISNVCTVRRHRHARRCTAKLAADGSTLSMRWSHSASDRKRLYRKSRGAHDSCCTSPSHSTCRDQRACSCHRHFVMSPGQFLSLLLQACSDQGVHIDATPQGVS